MHLLIHYNKLITLKYTIMKTSIIISGQIVSVSTLKRAIITHNCREIRLLNNSIELEFRTKKDAIRALSAAYWRLKRDMDDWKNSHGYYMYGECLVYDAGEARIN